MESCSEYGHRSAIPIERRGGNELVIQRAVDVLTDLKVIVGFQSFFPAVIQSAVAGKNARAARFEKFLMNLRETIGHARQTKRVVGPSPPCAFHADASGRRVIHVAEHPRFSFTVAPADPRKDAAVFYNFLFPVQTETIFVMISTGCFDVGGAGRII